MASSAWTAPRADLIKALADARAQQRIAEAQAAAERARAEAAETKAERAIRLARERSVRKERELRARLRSIKANAHHMANAVDAEIARRNTRPDPNADLHREVLLAALKEKP